MRDVRAAGPCWIWALVAWVLVVAATSTLAWVAISRAGDEVLGAPSAPLPDAGAAGGAVSSSAPTASPSTGPGSSSTTAPPPTTRPPATTGGSSTNPPAAQPVDRSATVTGGQVTVRCAGDVISLRAAIPSSGWTLRDESRVGEVRVEFRSDEGQSEVRATCVAGVPQLEVDDASD